MNTYPQAPYYDDFDEFKNFHQILFRPGYAVQARELTQLQSIIRNQIERFGNHIFKHGSVVIPGNAYADLDVPFVKIEDTYAGSSIDPIVFEGNIIFAPNPSGNHVYAMVKKVVPATPSEPIIFYLSYLTSGGESGTINSFSDGDELVLESNSSIRARVVSTNSTGVGSLASVNTGVFYIFGSFVQIDAQSIVIDKYSSKPSCRILLKINEKVITPNQDSSLLDPARGSYNYAAPGADRVQIELTLVSLSLDATLSNDYVELMRYENGILKVNNQYPQYSELEKSLARRTYDESGNYIVNGYSVSAREHLKTPYNSGVYENGNKDKFVIEVAPGKAYILGFETEIAGPTWIDADRARTDSHVKTKMISTEFKYGSYVFVSDFINFIPSFTSRRLVGIYNGSTRIGEFRPFALDYETNATDSADDDIYRMYYTDLLMYSIENSLSDATHIGDYTTGEIFCYIITRYTIQDPSVSFIEDEIISVENNSTIIRQSIIKKVDLSRRVIFTWKNSHLYSIPRVNDIIRQGSSSTIIVERTTFDVIGDSTLLFNLPITNLKSLKVDTTSTCNLENSIQYSVWKIFSAPIGATSVTLDLTTTTRFESFSSDNPLFATSSGLYTLQDFTPNTGISVYLSQGGTEITFDQPLPESIQIIARVNKIQPSPRTKILEENVTIEFKQPELSQQELILADSNKVYSDISRISSIILYPSANSYDNQSPIDITNYYTLDDGQRDSFYGPGKIVRQRALPQLASGELPGRIIVTFDYYRHSESGDYFSIDSYVNLSTPSDIPSYRSRISGRLYSLKNCLDFRPTVSNVDGSLYESDLPIINSFTTTGCQYYVPRIDKVYLDRNKTIGVVTGIPSESPITPSIPTGTLDLATVYVPAYTEEVTSISIRQTDHTRYTMKDINRLHERLLNVEYYSTLGNLENTLLNTQIIDPATGLNRYKTGYLVDTFTNPFSICDYYNKYNRCSFIDQTLSAAIETHDTELNYTLLENCRVTGSQITLDYVEDTLISQESSTHEITLNEFMSTEWKGFVRLLPDYEYTIDSEDLSKIYSSSSPYIEVTRGISSLDLPVSIPESALGNPEIISSIKPNQEYFVEYNGYYINTAVNTFSNSITIMLPSNYFGVVPSEFENERYVTPNWNLVLNTITSKEDSTYV